MFLDRNESPCGLQVLDNLLTALITVHPGILTGISSHGTIIIDYLNLGKVVTLTHIKVVGVMSRGYLDSTGTKSRVNIAVGKQRNLTTDKRQDKSLADHTSITLIIRMNSYTGITEHCFRTGGGDLYILIGTLDLIADMPKMSSFVFMLYFNVTEGSIAAGAPVRNTGTLIDQAVLVEADKYFTNSP